MPVTRTNPYTTRHQYRARIIWKGADGNDRVTHWSDLLQGSIDAIYSVHRFAQREQETNPDRKVVRPRLAPDQYRVEGLELVYKEHTSPYTEHVEPVEIPPGPNPDLRKKDVKKEPHPDFAFIDEVLSQTQTANQEALL